MNPKQRQLLVIIGAVAAAALAFVVVLALANRQEAPGIDFASLPQSRTEDGGFVVGNPEAPITIVEFADWACPHCQDYRSQIEQFIAQEVVSGRAKFEFRVFPTAGGQLTVFAGQIADCAEQQREGAFWEAYSLLYELATSGLYTEDLGQIVAQRLNLDYSELLTCSSESDRVTTDVEIARTVDVSGTPAVRVRYGDGPLQTIVFNGTDYTRSTVPPGVLSALVEQTQIAG